MDLDNAIRLREIINPALVRIDERFSDKTEVLRRVASVACKSPKLSGVREEFLFDQLLTRESVGSTGFGHGLAIPHCHLEHLEDFVVGCILAPDGVGFNSQDGKPVYIIPFIIAPQSAKRLHIRLLSRLSIALSTPEAKETLMASQSPEEAVENLVRFSRVQTRPQRTPKRNLVHIFLQGEDLLHQALEVLVGVGVTSLQVIETRSSASYLSNLSLFAGMWSDSEEEYSKTLIALIDARLGNELIRRIERLTGPLEERNDFAVCIQDVQFAGGQITLE